MSLVVNTNVGSLNAQRSLAASGAELKTAMERLSSGSKINSASDDAAGFAIAERMTAQIRGLNMAAKNAGDGLSMLSAIENATNDVTDMLQRMRELAVQAVNDTNTQQDREYLQGEVSALIAEIDRVATQTQYNGQAILDGSMSGKIQVGTEAGQTVDYQIDSIRKWDIGDIQYSRNFEGEATSVTYDSVTNTSRITLDTNTTSFQPGGPGLAIGGNGDFQVLSVSQGSASSGPWEPNTVIASAHSEGGELHIRNRFGVGTGSEKPSVGDNIVINDETYTISNINQDYAGSSWLPSPNWELRVRLENVDGSPVSNYASVTGATHGSDDPSLDTTVYSAGGLETVITVAGNATELHGGGTNHGTTIESAHGHHRSIESIDLVHNATGALSIISAAIEQVAGDRAEYGALQNRLEYTVSNLMNVSEFTTAARSRIADADFAAESARLAKAQVLQQSGTAMLAQANASSQLALSLIR